jgi:hypothetical protein
MEAQKLSDFDFESEISVNILGHIFEQSLTDLEEMNASINDTEFDKKKSKRKKDGVFYTPEYITRYIVENTLGKLCTDKKEELKIESETVVLNPRKLTKQEQSYKETLIAYREWLTHLKILDPACGSGAFLNQALEFLIREHTLIRDLLLPYEDLMIGYEIEKSILEHNLYGVDINEDAVEIAKLSLWLRTAHKGRELTSLNDKIVCANSLLAMPFEENSFDVVIGNPPYVALNKIKDVDYSRAGFEVFEKTGDLLALFIEKGLRLTADGKYFSFIVSNSWLKTKYGEPLKKFLEKNGQTEVLNFVGTQLFEDATVESCIVNAIRHSPVIPCHDTESTNSQWIPNQVRYDESITITNIRNFTTQNASVETLIEAIENSAGDDGESLLMRKIENIGKPLKEWDILIYRGITTGYNEAFVIDTMTKNELVAKDSKSIEIIKPVLRGRDVQKYETNWAEQWTIGIFPSLKISIDNYPAIKEYLESFAKRLDQSGEKGSRKKTSNQWFETQDKIGYWQDFEKPKIIWGEMADKPKFAFDDNNYYMNNTLFMMTGENIKYLLAFLNSKLSKWYFERISTTTGVGTTRWLIYKVELLPIAIADDETPFINLVDEILEIKPKIKEYKALLEEAIKNDNFDREIKLKKEIEAFEAFAEKGRKRTDKGEFWWELRACAYYEEFEKPKIMYQKFQVKPAFVYDTHGIFCNDSMWMLPKDDKVLLAILNSKIGWFLISSYCTSIQNGYQLIWKYLEQIPIPAIISVVQRADIEKIVDTQLGFVANLSNLQNEFKTYLSTVLSVAKIPAKLDTPEKMSFDELQTTLTKLKVDMKDISIFRSIKQLYDEMMTLQKEIDRVDGEIDKVVSELYGMSAIEIEMK